MSLGAILVLTVSALTVGIMAGCTGVGPAILPPLLAYLGGINLHIAIATSMWSFLLTSTAGAVAYARRKSVDWRMALWLSVSIIPAAILGARTNALLSAEVLTVILATVIGLAGLNALVKSPKGIRHSVYIKGPALLTIGAFVGFASSLTGTGGPILLIPILLMMRVTPLIAIGVSQAIIFPLAAFSVIGYLLYGQLDFLLGTLMGITLAVGVVFGAAIAHSLPTLVLQRVLAIVLISIGALMALTQSIG